MCRVKFKCLKHFFLIDICNVLNNRMMFIRCLSTFLKGIAIISSPEPKAHR